MRMMILNRQIHQAFFYEIRDNYLVLLKITPLQEELNRKDLEVYLK